MQILLRWNDYKRMWDMWDMEENFVEEFRNCKNFNRTFQKLDKTKDNIYEVITYKKDE